MFENLTPWQQQYQPWRADMFSDQTSVPPVPGQFTPGAGFGGTPVFGGPGGGMTIPPLQPWPMPGGSGGDLPPFIVDAPGGSGPSQPDPNAPPAPPPAPPSPLLTNNDVNFQYDVDPSAYATSGQGGGGGYDMGIKTPGGTLPGWASTAAGIGFGPVVGALTAFGNDRALENNRIASNQLNEYYGTGAKPIEQRSLGERLLPKWLGGTAEDRPTSADAVYDPLQAGIEAMPDPYRAGGTINSINSFMAGGGFSGPQSPHAPASTGIGSGTSMTIEEMNAALGRSAGRELYNTAGEYAEIESAVGADIGRGQVSINNTIDQLLDQMTGMQNSPAPAQMEVTPAPAPQAPASLPSAPFDIIGGATSYMSGGPGVGFGEFNGGDYAPDVGWNYGGPTGDIGDFGIF
jgi:hypothetical protein